MRFSSWYGSVQKGYKKGVLKWTPFKKYAVFVSNAVDPFCNINLDLDPLLFAPILQGSVNPV